MEVGIDIQNYLPHQVPSADGRFNQSLPGENGAGKTTLISMLCGLIKPTSGHFTIDALNYAHHSFKIKKIIDVIP